MNISFEKRQYFYNFVPLSDKEAEKTTENRQKNHEEIHLSACPHRRVLVLFIEQLGANRATKVYLFGFAASFNDSTVYFTEVQELDSAYIDSKTKFLYSRENYSYQLRDHLTAAGANTPTCVTCFALKRKDIDKKYANLKKKYTKGGKFIVKEVKSTDFHYQAIKPEE